jgi:hypothetical protein
MAKKNTKETPVDVEFTEIQTEITPEETITFEQPVHNDPEIIETNRFINIEILYEVTNIDRHAFDFADALVDIETIFGVEMVSDERLTDFGVDESSIEKYEINSEKCCLIYSSAYPDGVIVLDMTMHEMGKILIAYRG